VTRVALTTLGCKVNQSETDLLARRFAAAGYDCVPFDAEADVYVVNTCTVTHVADRKSRQLLSQAGRLNPEALVVATGCYASIVGPALSGEHRLVVRNRDKDRLVELVTGALGATPAIGTFADTEKYLDAPSTDVRARATVKAQDGCDSHCAYCIIPRARGRSRSVHADDVVRRVRALCSEGHPEVVITGVDLGSYGEDRDDAPDLGGLLRRVLDETSVPRVRVSSLEPGDFDPDWLSLWDDPRLCRHLHVPLQAGSTAVLRRMGRSYTTADFAAMVSLCRRHIPGVAITTDVMVGFPGETDSQFDEGVAFIREVQFDGMHVFRYSRRSGTRAAAMEGQVPEEVKAARSAVLRTEAESGVRRLLDRHLGKRVQVAWEAETDGVRRGLTDTNVRTYGTACGPALSVVELTHPFRDGLWAEPAVPEIPLVPYVSSGAAS